MVNLPASPEKVFPLTQKELDRFSELYPIHAAIMRLMVTSGEAVIVPEPTGGA